MMESSARLRFSTISISVRRSRLVRRSTDSPRRLRRRSRAIARPSRGRSRMRLAHSLSPSRRHQARSAATPRSVASRSRRWSPRPTRLPQRIPMAPAPPRLPSVVDPGLPVAEGQSVATDETGCDEYHPGRERSERRIAQLYDRRSACRRGAQRQRAQSHLHSGRRLRRGR